MSNKQVFDEGKAYEIPIDSVIQIKGVHLEALLKMQEHSLKSNPLVTSILTQLEGLEVLRGLFKENVENGNFPEAIEEAVVEEEIVK